MLIDSSVLQITIFFYLGDLNYRKLGGDITWPCGTEFATFLQGFKPAPLAALRTIKAEIICGLSSSKFEELTESDSSWMTKGEYGLIQFIT